MLSVCATGLDRLLRGIFKERSISWIQALEWISTDSYYDGKAKKGKLSHLNDTNYVSSKHIKGKSAVFKFGRASQQEGRGIYIFIIVIIIRCFNI